MNLTSCIFDWKRTLYDPEKDELMPGSLTVLDLLIAHQVPCVLIGKGGPEMNDKVESLQVKKFFQHVVFGGSEKSPELFQPFINHNQPKKTLVIGDRARGEIEIGNQLGATTIWVRQGKFASEEPLNSQQEATFVVASLLDLHSFLKKKYL